MMGGRSCHSLLILRGSLVSDAVFVNDGADESSVEHQKVVFPRPQMRSRHGVHKVQVLLAAIVHVVDVIGQDEMTVDYDSEDPHSVLIGKTRGPQLQLQVNCRCYAARNSTAMVYIVDTLNPHV